jgi:hypothetical protein
LIAGLYFEPGIFFSGIFLAMLRSCPGAMCT